MSDETREGLLAKYRVERLDDPVGKHADCRYFVLDPQHDPLAVAALAEYAAEAEVAGFTELANDLNNWLDRIEGGEDTC